MSHPLDWRREIMVDCDCCHATGQVCRLCGWHEDTVNDPKIHEAHLAHIRETQMKLDEHNRYDRNEPGS